MNDYNHSEPLLDHWSWAWARPLFTVGGLLAAAAVMVVIAFFQVWPAWPDLLLKFSIGGIAVYIGYYMQETPNATRERFFNVAWALIAIALLI